MGRGPRPFRLGRFLLDRRAGKPDDQGNYTAAPIVDVGLNPCPTITGAAFGKSVWTVRDTMADDPAGVILRNRRDSAKRIEEHGERPNRRGDEPAPAITGEAWRWAWDTDVDTPEDSQT